MTPRVATCTLTRSVSLHAMHHYSVGGPAAPHGHLYRIEVTVGGRLAADQSSLLDLAGLDAVLTQEITEPIGGSDLNVVIPEVAGGTRQPTCEALAVWCWQRIAPRLPGSVSLIRVRVAEDATLWADCTGLE